MCSHFSVEILSLRRVEIPLAAIMQLHAKSLRIPFRRKVHKRLKTANGNTNNILVFFKNVFCTSL